MSASPAFAHATSTDTSQRTTTIQSDVLGTIEVPTESLIEFPRGLFGFPECTRFALVGIANRGGLFWLQSLQHRALAFVLVDPFVAIDGYSVDLSETDRIELGVSAPADVAVLAIVTLSRGPGDSCTANLQGPLAVNLRTRTGKQLALAEKGRGVRVPVDLKRCDPERSEGSAVNARCR